METSRETMVAASRGRARDAARASPETRASTREVAREAHRILGRERWHLAVLRAREPGEDGGARVDDDVVDAACARDGVDERAKVVVLRLGHAAAVVEALEGGGAALDADRRVECRRHRLDARGRRLRRPQQARAVVGAARLHRRAAGVQVELGEAAARGGGDGAELARVGAANL